MILKYFQLRVWRQEKKEHCKTYLFNEVDNIEMEHGHYYDTEIFCFIHSEIQH